MIGKTEISNWIVIPNKIGWNFSIFEKSAFLMKNYISTKYRSFFIIQYHSRWGRGLKSAVLAGSSMEVTGPEIKPEVEEIPKGHNGKYIFDISGASFKI